MESPEKSAEIEEESPVRASDSDPKQFSISALLNARDKSYKDEKSTFDKSRKTVKFEEEAVLVDPDENFDESRKKGFSIRRMKT